MVSFCTPAMRGVEQQVFGDWFAQLGVGESLVEGGAGDHIFVQDCLGLFALDGLVQLLLALCQCFHGCLGGGVEDACCDGSREGFGVGR